MPIVIKRRDEADLSGVDWEKIRATTDEDIERMAAEDPDTPPPATDEELARARWVVPTPSPDDVRAIRRRLGLSQMQFAERFGFSVETLRNYEQGHRQPRGPARVLLKVIAAEPEAVERALAKGG